MMITNKDMRDFMSKNAREMIASRFDKDFVQLCQIDYYKEILR